MNDGCGHPARCMWGAQGGLVCDKKKNAVRQRPQRQLTRYGGYVDEGTYELDCHTKNTPAPVMVPLEWMERLDAK